MMAVVLYLSILLYNIFLPYIPLSNYYDEVLCVALCGMMCWQILQKSGRLYVQKEDLLFFFGSVFLLLTGIMANALFGYAGSKSAVVRDIVNTYKCAVSLFCVRYLMGKPLSDSASRFLLKFSKWMLAVIFLCGCVSLFWNIGLGDDLRFGIRSYRFLYPHYTYLVFNVLLLLCTIAVLDDAPHWFWYVAGFGSMLLTMRTKAVMIGVLSFVILCFGKRRVNRKISIWVHSFWVVPCLCYAAGCKVLEYVSWGVTKSLRVGLMWMGANLMQEHFPLGTGFGTFGTNLSYDTMSAVYQKYQEMDYDNLMLYGNAVFSDSFWPSVYGQFGLFGMLAYFMVLCVPAWMLYRTVQYNSSVRRAVLCLFGYMLIASIAESVFTNETGVFLAVYIGILFMAFRPEKCV